MAREPSEKQLDYLKGLGYRGIQPETMTEASILIDEMKSSGDSNAAAEILRSYRLSTPTESSSGRGAKGCLVMLLLIGGCVYWGSDSKDPPPRQKSIPVPQIVTPPSIELAPSVPPPDQPAAESPPPQAPAIVESSVSEEPPAATTEDTNASEASDAEADRLAATQLHLAKQYIRIEHPADARKILDAMIEKYPDAKATAEAKVLRESLSKKPR